MLTETQRSSESAEKASNNPTEPCPQDGLLTHKRAAENLTRALKAKGISVEVDGRRRTVTAKLNGKSQVVALRGSDDDLRWCFVWPPEGRSGRPTLDPVTSIGNEQILAGRILGVLELAQLKV
ncbi:hypothetical protein GCM10009603_62350 [Nocardiopsis exhalans]